MTVYTNDIIPEPDDGCRGCGGTGTVPREWVDSNGDVLVTSDLRPMRDETVCTVCHGSGKLSGRNV